MALFPWKSVPSALYVGRRRPRRRRRSVKGATGALCPPYTPVLKAVEDSVVRTVAERSASTYGGADINALTDYAYKAIYPAGPMPIPSTGGPCRAWAKAWLRLRDEIKLSLFQAGLPSPNPTAVVPGTGHSNYGLGVAQGATHAVSPTGSRTYSPFNLDSRGVPTVPQPAVSPTGSRTYSPFNLNSRGVPIAPGMTGLAGYRTFFGTR
jgi:hypothetical protein